MVNSLLNAKKGSFKKPRRIWSFVVFVVFVDLFHFLFFYLFLQFFWMTDR